MEERKAYSEHDLETALIDKIEHFLLELGKGFLFESRQKRFTFDNRHFYVDLVFYNRLLRYTELKVEFFRDRVEITSMGGLPYGVTKNDFFGGCSIPRNKELMRVMRITFTLGEKWGGNLGENESSESGVTKEQPTSCVTNDPIINEKCG